MKKHHNKRASSKGLQPSEKTTASANQIIAGADREHQTVETINQGSKQPPPHTETGNNGGRFWGWRLSRAEWISFATMLVMLLQAAIYYWTLQEVSRSANVAQAAVSQTRDQFRQDQRPFVWLTNDLGQPEFVPKPGTPTGQVVWDWHFTNYGKTPAYGIRFRQYFKVGNEFRPGFGSTEQPGIGSPLPPTKVNFSTNVSDPINADEFSRLIDLDQAIAIRIVMEYTDAYGGKYESGFCLERLRTKAITYCQDGNYVK